jgi:hypothetical protein
MVANKPLRREVKDSCPIMPYFATRTVVACSAAGAIQWRDQTALDFQWPSIMFFCDLLERLVCQSDGLHVREL